MPRSRRLDQEAVRALALALPEAEESSHFGTPDFRVRKKIFATLPPKHPGRAHVKATPIDVTELVRADPETYADAWGGRWLAVELARITPTAFEQLLRDAYRLAAPKRLAAALDDGNPARFTSGR